MSAVRWLSQSIRRPFTEDDPRTDYALVRAAVLHTASEILSNKVRLITGSSHLCG
jgi:hypothetical protein